MQRSFAQFRSILTCTVLACALGACATLPPPTAEIGTAQQAVVRATGADADQYAGEQITLARDGLARAQGALAEGRNDAALALALASAADADLAWALSREALATAELTQRETEVRQLERRLQQESRR